MLKGIRETFHEILDELDDQVIFSVSEQRLKAEIIERLLYLATHDTPQQEWKADVLRSLPLR